MNKPLNITFKITKEHLNKTKEVFVTFYHIDAIYPSVAGNAVIVSGGKEWNATSTYEEIWEKLKHRIDEVNS